MRLPSKIKYQTAVKKCGKTEYTYCGVYIKPKDFKPFFHGFFTPVGWKC